MSIAKHISSLLYDHECVIVPSFGGFVTNYAPAHYNEISQVFNPPAYKITFNQHLQNNDGLLINHIKDQDNISYEQAKDQVNKWVANAQKTLHGGTKLHVAQIGILSLNSQGQYHFYPDSDINYLKDAYGLSAFRIKLLQQEKPQEVKVTESDSDVKIVNIKQEEKHEEAETKKYPKRKYWVAAAIVFILASSYVVTFHSTIIPGVERNYSSLIPQLFDHTPGIYEARDFEVAYDTTNSKSVSEQLLKSTDPIVNIQLVEDASIPGLPVRLRENPADVPAKIDNTEVNSKSAKRLRYHVIGGCFAVKSNAKKLVKRLKKMGYNASIIGRHKNLYAVSYESFGTREEAVAKLESVRNNHNNKAWLLDKY